MRIEIRTREDVAIHEDWKHERGLDLSPSPALAIFDVLEPRQIIDTGSGDEIKDCLQADGDGWGNGDFNCLNGDGQGCGLVQGSDNAVLTAFRGLAERLGHTRLTRLRDSSRYFRREWLTNDAGNIDVQITLDGES